MITLRQGLRSILGKIGIRLSAGVWEIDEALDDDVAHSLTKRKMTVDDLVERAYTASRANDALSKVIKQAKLAYVTALHSEVPDHHFQPGHHFQSSHHFKRVPDQF